MNSMDPKDIICPREASSSSPCIARDGSPSLTTTLDGRACSGCGITPLAALEALATRWPRAAHRLAGIQTDVQSGTSDIANDLPGLVMGYLEDVERVEERDSSREMESA